MVQQISTNNFRLRSQKSLVGVYSKAYLLLILWA